MFESNSMKIESEDILLYKNQYRDCTHYTSIQIIICKPYFFSIVWFSAIGKFCVYSHNGWDATFGQSKIIKLRNATFKILL